MKILVVDDDNGVRNAIKRLLVSLGHEATLAADGFSALEILRQNTANDGIKMVITDYNMKEMNGEELAVEIKKIDSHLPIVLISSDNDKIKNREYFDYVLDKPFDWHDLAKIIDKII